MNPKVLNLKLNSLAFTIFPKHLNKNARRRRHFKNNLPLEQRRALEFVGALEDEDGDKNTREYAIR